jgi:hypothetical protein
MRHYGDDSMVDAFAVRFGKYLSHIGYDIFVGVTGDEHICLYKDFSYCQEKTSFRLEYPRELDTLSSDH